MLLDEIIDLATDESKSVSVLLRKCLVLGHKLKNDRLIAWANQELNGYTSHEGLPDYRIVPAAAKAYMSGPMGMSINNFPIPSLLLEKEHRYFATTLYLTDALATYEELMRADHDSFRVDWPADLALLYQKRIRTQNGCFLAHAWQEVGKSSFAALFDAIRNRTLSLALEIRSSIGDKDSTLDSVPPQAAATIDRSITHNIYGGINVIASGHSHVNSILNNATIAAGNKDQLESVLRQAGLPENSLEDLFVAIRDDGGKNKIGARVQSWIKENAPKALVGGIKVGASVAQSVLTSFLLQYYGITKP